MAKISLWRETKGNDYKFIDKTIRGMYEAGGTGLLMHKYLGIIDQGPSTDVTQPQITEDNVTSIQDLLFLENRDRKYDPDVYSMRGIYQRADQDFDLSQFGLFLQNGTIMMTFHYNDMIETLGRRIVSGDVVELLHLKDYDAPNDIASALKRYYVAGDCSYATEGFSPTWYPHLWRVKFDPLVDSQEYKDILNQIPKAVGPIPTTNTPAGPLKDLLSTYEKYMDVNEAILAQAEAEVPLSGYDVSHIYSPLSDADGKVTINALTTDNSQLTADTSITADNGTYSPTTAQNPKGYLTGDGLAPNGLAVIAGVTFPVSPTIGIYCLRLDYLPNRLFRFDGRRWVKVEDNVRTNITPGAPNNMTLRNSFANNDNTRILHNGVVAPERQGLSKALRPPKNY